MVKSKRKEQRNIEIKSIVLRCHMIGDIAKESLILVADGRFPGEMEGSAVKVCT